ncbi:MAG: serine/threonine-protein kinase [Planctomycetota bacterium]
MLPDVRLSPGETTGMGSSPDETQPMHTPRLEKIGSFLVEEKIGEGGMGVVYRARDPRLQRTVAIKRIHPNLHGRSDIRELFLTEARAIAAVSHPNIGQIHAIHEDEDPPYLVMEYLEGPSFGERLDTEGALGVAEAIRVAIAATRALKAAVSRGIIHRDVKPSNLLTDSRGEVKLVDFGLAGNLGENPQEEPEFLCTPQYGSPEQVQGWVLDERSDIYSLGATIFHLLTGKPPFERESRVELLVAQANEPAPDPSTLREGIHPDLASLVLKMLEKRPEDRPPTHSALLEDLLAIQRVVDPGAIETRKPSMLATGLTVGVVVICAVAATLFWQGNNNGGGIRVDGTLRGVLSAAPPYERLEYDFTRDGQALERFFRFPAVTRDSPGHPRIAPIVRDGQLRWANDPRTISFPYLKELREWKITGLRCLGSPDLELRVAQDPERPGDRLRIGIAIGRPIPPRIEALKHGEVVAIELEEETISGVFLAGVDHQISLLRLASEDPAKARFRFQIEREDAQKTQIVRLLFSLPDEAVPRGAPSIRCEGDLASWNTKLNLVEIVGVLDRDRIQRSWILEGGP